MHHGEAIIVLNEAAPPHDVRAGFDIYSLMKLLAERW